MSTAIADAESHSASVSSSFARELGRALARGDSFGRSYPVPDLLASRRSGNGSSTAGQGRESGGTPPFTRDAARGALVFAAVEAVEAGDAAVLTELGVDLRQLQGLTGRELFAELARLILGSPSHPDDLAVSQAVLATLASGEPGASLSDRIAQFVAALAWQRAAVQLASNRSWRDRAKTTIRAFEAKAKGWIRARVTQIADVLANRSAQEVANYASDLAARACHEFSEEL